MGKSRGSQKTKVLFSATETRKLTTLIGNLGDDMQEVAYSSLKDKTKQIYKTLLKTEATYQSSAYFNMEFKLFESKIATTNQFDKEAKKWLAGAKETFKDHDDILNTTNAAAILQATFANIKDSENTAKQ